MLGGKGRVRRRVSGLVIRASVYEFMLIVYHPFCVLNRLPVVQAEAALLRAAFSETGA
jgi:hypothetical protein